MNLSRILCSTQQRRMHVSAVSRILNLPSDLHLTQGLFISPLQSHPKLGASWEGFALETVAQALNKRADELFFWRTHTGNEIDLFWQAHGKNWAVKFKYADAPRLSKAMKIAANDLNLSHLWIVYPGQEAYALSDAISVLPLTHIVDNWSY